MKLSIIATLGLGLKLCVSPSEIGNTKKNTNHITLNHKTPNEIGKMETRNLLFSVRWKCILANPITAPIVTIIIPKASVMWVGLSKPSIPNNSCQKKSPGPAIICNAAQK